MAAGRAFYDLCLFEIEYRLELLFRADENGKNMATLYSKKQNNYPRMPTPGCLNKKLSAPPRWIFAAGSR
jgi:hypothetical protein